MKRKDFQVAKLYSLIRKNVNSQYEVNEIEEGNKKRDINKTICFLRA